MQVIGMHASVRVDHVIKSSKERSNPHGLDSRGTNSNHVIQL